MNIRKKFKVIVLLTVYIGIAYIISIHLLLPQLTSNLNIVKSKSEIRTIEKEAQLVKTPTEAAEKAVDLSCYSVSDVSNLTLYTHNQLNAHPACIQDLDLVYIHRNSSILFNYAYLESKDIKFEKCVYSVITHFNNEKASQSVPIPFQHGDTVDLNAEFFSISCLFQTSKYRKRRYEYFRSISAHVFKKNKAFADRQLPKNQPINVMFLGLDSVSKENWLTMMPKSSYFLFNKLGSNLLNGYNIVGDGTPAALIPVN